MLCAGGARRGRLRLKPPLQGEVSPQATEGCGTLPCQYPSGVAQIFPAGVHARRGSWRRQTGLRRAKSPALHCARGRAAAQNQQPHVRPDGGPTQGSPLCPGARGPAVPGSASRLPCIVGRAFTPAAWGLAAAQGFRDDASIVPYGHGARSCRALQDTSAANRQCTPPSAPCGAATSPCRGGFGGLPFERLPCKGLRSRAPPAADTARRSRCRGRRMQARFSVCRMMRAPQTGNVGKAD